MNRSSARGLLPRSRMAGAAVALLALAGILGGVPVGASNSSSGVFTASAGPCFAWNTTGSPNDGGGDNVLYGVSASAPDNVWAVGYSTSDTDKTLAMRWNGGSWSTVASPNPIPGPNYLNGVAVLAPNNVWAVGVGGPDEHPVPFIVHWDGSQWTQSRLPDLDESGNELDAITALSANDIWAVGTVGSSKSKTFRSLAMHYNGVDWQVTPTHVDGYAEALTGVSALSSGDVWAVGYVYREFPNYFGAQPLAMHWNGTGWEAVETQRFPAQLNILTAVHALATNNVWAVGYKRGNSSSPLANHWDGSYWTQVDMPAPSNDGSALFGVSGSAPDDVWAVGYFLSSGARRALFMHYDGRAWSQTMMGDAGAGATLYAITTVNSGGPVAVGYSGAPSLRTLIERYSDTCSPPTATPAPPPQPTATPQPVATVEIPGTNSRTFPETGKTVTGLFLDYWQNNGGLAQQGFPISPVIGEISPLNGKPYTVQYFERAVFEYHPENQPPYNVLLSQLGTFQYKKKYPTGAPGQTPNRTNGRLFSETGHWVGGKFLDYWNTHGGLAQQGFPISDEFTEVSDLNGKPYTVQYFERAVFEYHPENQPPYDVLLSQLGTFQYKQKYGGK